MATIRSSPLPTTPITPVESTPDPTPVRQVFEDYTPDYTDVDGMFHALRAAVKNSQEKQQEETNPKLQKFYKILELLRGL